MRLGFYVRPFFSNVPVGALVQRIKRLRELIDWYPLQMLITGSLDGWNIIKDGSFYLYLTLEK